MTFTPRLSALAASALAAMTLVHTAVAGVRLAVSAGPEPARAGELLAVEITVTNDDAFDRTDLTLTLTVPGSLDSINDSLFDGDCPGSFCESGETATLFIPFLPAGRGVTLLIPPRVSSSAAAGSVIPFDVSVFDNGSLQATGSSSVTVASNRLLNLSCIDSADPVEPGAIYQYRLVYGVREASSGAAGAVLALPLPPGVVFVGASQGGGLVGNEVRWTLGSLAPGSVGERTATVMVTSGVDAGTILATEATFASSGGNLTATQHATRVEWQPGLRCVAVLNPDPVRTGELSGLEVTVSNAGSFDRVGVQLLVQAPDFVVAPDDSLFDGDCPGSFCEAAERALFDIGFLAAGDGASFTIPIRADLSTPDGTVVPFRAMLVDASGEVVDAATAMAVSDARVVELVVSDRRDPVAPGEAIPYTLSYGVREGGPGINAAVLAMPVPAGTTFASASDGGTLVNGVVQWTLGNLGAGSVGERTVTFVASPGLVPGSVVEAETSFRDATTRYALAGSATRIDPFEELEVSVVASPTPALPGETLWAEVAVANRSEFDRQNLLVTLFAPEGVIAIDDSLFDGDCFGSFCEAAERAFFTIESLRAGEGMSFWVPVRVDAATPDGTIIPFRARIDDGVGGLREDETAVGVREQRILNLALSEQADPVRIGDQQIYTLTYGVRETSGGAANAVLRMPVPAGLQFVSASGGGTLVNGTVEWTLGALGPGAIGEREAVFAVPASVVPGTIARVTASLSSSSSNVVRTELATRFELADDAFVRIAASPDPARPGESMDVEVTIGNRGPFDLSGVGLRVLVPQGFDSLDDDVYEGDCAGSFCESDETSFFTIGTLRAGDVRTYNLPFQVAGGELDGTVRRFTATLVNALGTQRHASAAVAIDDTRTMEIGMAASAAQVAPGGTVAVSIVYGTYASSGGAPNATLRCFIPAGMQAIGTSDGGVVSGGVVTWTLGGINGGAGGRRTVTLSVDPSVPVGTSLALGAQLADAANPINEIRATETIAVRAVPSLLTKVIALPEKAAPGTLAGVQLVVTNGGAFDRTGVLVTIEYPQGLDSLDDTGLPGGCPGSFCEPSEIVSWPIGTLVAGESACFSLAPQVSNSTPSGSVVPFDVVTTDAFGDRSSNGALLFIGTQFSAAPLKVGDLDGDGIVSAPDVAILLGAWGASGCGEPADLNGDGSVGAPDLAVILGNWG